MKLYYNPLSAYSRKVLLAFEEKQQTFEHEIVDLFSEDAKAAYREVHPLGKVPLLMVDGDYPIPESSIIIEYLDTHFMTGTKLIPSDKDLARKARFHDRVSDLYYLNPVVSLLLDGFKPEDRRARDFEKEAWREQINTSLGLFNKGLDNKKYALGEEFTMGDLSPAAATFWWTFMQNSLDEHQNLKAWYERVTARPAWQRVQAAAEPFLAKLPQPDA